MDTTISKESLGSLPEDNFFSLSEAAYKHLIINVLKLGAGGSKEVLNAMGLTNIADFLDMT